MDTSTSLCRILGNLCRFILSYIYVKNKIYRGEGGILNDIKNRTLIRGFIDDLRLIKRIIVTRDKQIIKPLRSASDSVVIFVFPYILFHLTLSLLIKSENFGNIQFTPSIHSVLITSVITFLFHS